eukprot:CAMPEP_0195304188 /NCGR_PEP_ID=MMETSP0707-20130614/34019_1 /TAXON_ID=33640 /ORGANISM="Asterionellopsis glacialis, Strain CCMP134" /LENGTH=441 /DNA_ID=CAMNT_0040367929 /DNA_START=58 /DNA_END=1383 /DNA_ORIENTATION=-
MTPKMGMSTATNDILGTSSTEDTIFSAMLVDDQGFFFPTIHLSTSCIENETDNHQSRFIRRALSENSVPVATAPHDDNFWSYDWKQDMDAKPAIGEYYRGKGLAIQDYYRTKYDPTYKSKTTPTEDTSNIITTAGNSSYSPPTDSKHIFSYDWELDKDRGISIGELYQKIGEAIEDHYRQLFDPTYEAFFDDENKTTSYEYYTWEADRIRGMALAQYYKNLGAWITEHYKQEYVNPINDPVVDANRKEEFKKQWKEYKKMGEELANYYHDKGISIEKYYEQFDSNGKFHGFGDDDLSLLSSSLSSGDNIHNGIEAEQYVWGLDWANDKDHAVELHKEWMERGTAIAKYYRSKYDPTYGSAFSTTYQPKTIGDVHKEFPPWGVNATADKAHGKAIGQFYKNRGENKPTNKKKQGKKIGKYYEDYYRKIFDPTYNDTEDLNWR